MINDTHAPELPLDETDLPTWMRRAMRGNDWGALLTIAFSLLAAWYFILYPDLPRYNANENYAYMVSDYAAAIQEGRLYPRWAAHAQGGYGIPLYHYAPPGAAYLGGVLTVLFTDNPVSAVRIVYLLGFMLAGVGVYGLVVRHRGAAAAVIAATLYVTSPYISLTTPHILGELPMGLAMGLLPVMLWSVHRLVAANYPQDFGFVTVTTAALLLTEPRVMLVGGVMAAALIGWYCLFVGIKHRRRCYPRLALAAMALGLLLAGFYWIPAVAERDMVRWAVHTQTTRPLFLTLRGLTAPFHQVDPAALIPEPQLTLGWLRLLVAALSVIGVVRVQRWFTLEALFLAGGLLTWVLALVLLPTQTWLVGVMALCAALSSGAALALRDGFSARVQRLVLAIALLVILGASHPAWLPPQPHSVIRDLSPSDQIQHERSGFGVAVVPKGSPYPTTLPDDVPTSNTLIASYREPPLNRVNRDELSGTLRITPLTAATHSTRMQVSARIAHPLTVLTAHFPGWRAKLNRRDISIAPNPENQLINLSIPATDNGVLRLWLGGTLARQLSWLVSLTAFVALLYVTRRRYRFAQRQFHATRLLTLPEVRLLTLLFAFAALIIVFTARFDAPISIRVQPGSQMQDIIPLGLRSNTGVNLLGYRLNRETFKHGDMLQLTLHWSTLRELTENYRVQVTLESLEGGVALWKPDMRYPGGMPPTRWALNRVIADPHYIEIAGTIPPGMYTVGVSLQPCDTAACDQQSPIFYNAIGAPLGERYPLPEAIEIMP